MATALRDTHRCPPSRQFHERTAARVDLIVEPLTKALAGYTVVSSPETGKKETRAEPYAVQVNNGHVEMIEAEWNAAYREELKPPFARWPRPHTVA
jgi:phage terminase large subunit-like protein